MSGAVVAGAIFGYQHARRQERVDDLKASIPELGRGHKGDKVGTFRLCEDLNGVGVREERRIWRCKEMSGTCSNWMMMNSRADRRSEAYRLRSCIADDTFK